MGTLPRRKVLVAVLLRGRTAAAKGRIPDQTNARGSYVFWGQWKRRFIRRMIPIVSPRMRSRC